MSDQEFDVIVIGSGPGGYVAAIRAAQLGLKTACVEKEPTFGGTCLNVGCIPSKALLQSSEHYAFLNEKAKDHGIHFKNLSFDFKQMMSRKDEVVDSLVKGVAGLLKKNQITTFHGAAKFVSPQEIEIREKRIKGKHFILATGSESIPLPFLKIDEEVVLSSTGALALKTVPKKMTVIGAGVIGVELASVYKRLGTEVVIVEMLEKICPTLDDAISRSLHQSLKKQGLTFHLGAQVTEAKVSNSQVLLKVKTKQDPLELVSDVVLVAIGRRPYSKGLGLEEIGIKKSEKGFVVVDAQFRTNHSHIFAIGDLIDGPMLAHRASEEGVAAAEIIAGKPYHINYVSIPNVIYTHPEVAAIGFAEEEAKKMQLAIKIGTFSFKGNPRARCAGDTDGMVKIIGEETTGRLLGLHIVGPNASEMIGEGVVAIEKKATLKDLAYASHAHPTLSEAIKEAALNALGIAIHL